MYQDEGGRPGRLRRQQGPQHLHRPHRRPGRRAGWPRWPRRERRHAGDGGGTDPGDETPSKAKDAAVAVGRASRRTATAPTLCTAPRRASRSRTTSARTSRPSPPAPGPGPARARQDGQGSAAAGADAERLTSSRRRRPSWSGGLRTRLAGRFFDRGAERNASLTQCRSPFPPTAPEQFMERFADPLAVPVRGLRRSDLRRDGPGRRLPAPERSPPFSPTGSGLPRCGARRSRRRRSSRLPGDGCGGRRCAAGAGRGPPLRRRPVRSRPRPARRALHDGPGRGMREIGPVARPGRRRRREPSGITSGGQGSAEVFWSAVRALDPAAPDGRTCPACARATWPPLAAEGRSRGRRRRRADGRGGARVVRAGGSRSRWPSGRPAPTSRSLETPAGPQPCGRRCRSVLPAPALPRPPRRPRWAVQARTWS